jgi:hypothetical protein
MANYETELELESLPELESEFESESENEQFLGGILKGIGGLFGGGGDSEFESEFELESEFESELEGELESELGEHELNPIRRVYPDALMEHMAHAAAESESEHEAAEHFLPLIGLAASKLLPMAMKVLPRALPKIANVVQRVTPQLTRGVGRLARGLFRNRRTRPLLRTVPTIVNRTVGTLARQAAQGQVISPQYANALLRRQAGQVLRNRQYCIRLLRRSAAFDRGFHRVAGVPSRGHCHCR